MERRQLRKRMGRLRTSRPMFVDANFIGGLAAVSLIGESSLKHDECGFTYNNGPFMVMESMYWINTQVTAKRLHKSPPNGGQVDFLIEEYKYISRWRHPNILLLMGQCNTRQCDNLVLVYERVHLGSLFSFLYQKAESLSSYMMCEVLRQICDAVLFLHQHSLIHCAISSHAIHLVSHGCAKLGNFEYMIKRDEELLCAPSLLLENRYPNAVYNWLSPEIMAGCRPTERSDLYSLVSVIWEIVNGMPPWSGMQAVDIQIEMVSNQNRIHVNKELEHPFSTIMQYGLAPDPAHRRMSVLQLRNMLHSYLLDEDNVAVTRKHVTPLWEEQPTTETVEVSVVEPPRPEAPPVIEVLPTDSSQSPSADEECTFVKEQDSTLIQRTTTSTPVPNNTQTPIPPPENRAPPTNPVHESTFNESVISSVGPKTDNDGATTFQMADLSEESNENATVIRSKKSSKRKSSATKTTDARRNSSFLRSAARKMFSRTKRSDTEESASEIEGKNIKTTKSETKQSISKKKKKSKSPKPFPFDMSGISKLHQTDSSQPPSDRDAAKDTDQSQDSQNSTNPFKKFTSAKYEDIISDEIKAILAKPITMPKLPSHFRRDSLILKRQSVEQTGSVYGTLVRQFSQSSKTRNLFSPTDGTPHSVSLDNSRNRSMLTACGNKTLSANTSSHSLQSLNSSTVKPASHHTPDKTDNQRKHLPHFAFPKEPRAGTLPGNVSLLTRSSATNLLVGNDLKAKSLIESKEPLTVQTGTQTPDYNTSEKASPKSSLLTKFQERKAMSQRDIFFGIKSPEVFPYRSETYLGKRQDTKMRKLAAPKTDRPVSRAMTSTPPVQTKKSVRDMIASFQGQLEEHIRKQASLVKVNKNETGGDVFYTPAQLKKDVIPRRMDRIQNYRVAGTNLTKQPQVAVASIYLDKPRTLSLKQLSPPSVDAHGASYVPAPQQRKQQIERKEREQWRKRGITKGFETGSETEEEVTQFVGRVISTAHGDVVKEHTPSKSDMELSNYVNGIIDTVHTDVSSNHMHMNQGQKQLDQNVNNNCAAGRSSAGSGRSSDEFSAKKQDPDIEEIYFDDVLDSSLCQDKNMRLQSTMALDTPEYITAVFEPKTLFSNGQKRNTPAGNKLRMDTPVGDTPMYPHAAMSGRRFKFSRTVTRLLEDATEPTEQGSGTGFVDSHDSSGTIDV